MRFWITHDQEQHHESMSIKDMEEWASAGQQENVHNARIYRTSGNIKNFFVLCAKVESNIL